MLAEQDSLHALRLGDGQGVPVIMLHGWGQSLESLQPLGELLLAEASVHLIDLPGFGKSEKSDEVWGTKKYAERIAAYLEQMGLEEAVFLGHSFGGKVSLKFATLYPERVRALVLMGASGLRPKRALRMRIRSLFLTALRKVIWLGNTSLGKRIYENWYIPRYASADYKSSGSLRRTFVRVVNEDLSAELPKIEARTLLLWGDMDTETPLESAERMHQALPNSKLIVLPDKDHYLFAGSGAHLCAYRIIPFLQDVLNSNSDSTEVSSGHA